MIGFIRFMELPDSRLAFPNRFPDERELSKTRRKYVQAH